LQQHCACERSDLAASSAARLFQQHCLLAGLLFHCHVDYRSCSDACNWVARDVFAQQRFSHVHLSPWSPASSRFWCKLLLLKDPSSKAYVLHSGGSTCAD
jgi:hypothetical protein